IIGPYDKFAIEWGYKCLPNAKCCEDEKADLDIIAARQVKDARLRFGNASGEDPSVQMEDLGSDAIEATRLGLMNLRRVAKNLIPATTTFGENYDRLKDEWQQLLSQRRRELGHVATLVGGVVETDYHAGREIGRAHV